MRQSPALRQAKKRGASAPGGRAVTPGRSARSAPPPRSVPPRHLTHSAARKESGWRSRVASARCMIQSCGGKVPRHPRTRPVEGRRGHPTARRSCARRPGAAAHGTTVAHDVRPRTCRPPTPCRRARTDVRSRTAQGLVPVPPRAPTPCRRARPAPGRTTYVVVSTAVAPPKASRQTERRPVRKDHTQRPLAPPKRERWPWRGCGFME